MVSAFWRISLADLLALSRFFAAVCLVSLGLPQATAANTALDACVYSVSVDGLLLHAPPGADCARSSQEPEPDGDSGLAFATEIPPGNPFVPSDPHPRLGRGPWQPVEIGTRILYRSSLKRSLYSGDQLTRVIRYRGDRSDEVLAAGDGYGAARHEVRTTVRLSGEIGAGNIHETQRHFVVPGDLGPALEVSEVATAGARRMVRQPPGVLLYSADARPKERWRAGTHYVDGLEFSRRGEVLGLQDIETKLGRFEKCLVVRYTSRLARAGVSPLAGNAPVSDARLVETQWYARGLGLVFSQSKGELRLNHGDGVPGRVVFESRSQIHQYQRLADQRDTVPVAALDVGAKVRPGIEWVKGSWRLSLDRNQPVGEPLPMDVMRIRPDGKVDLSKRTRVYDSCPYAVSGDILTVRCENTRQPEPLVFDLVISPDRQILTTAMGSQYSRSE
jgi:hypothetical protein